MSSNARRLARKVQSFSDDLEDETERGLAVGMGALVGRMKHHLITERSVATGTLLRNLESRRAVSEEPGVYATREIVGPDYWRYLEFGTGIHTSRGYKAPSPGAPAARIFTWVEAKGIVPDPTGPYDTQWELAKAIAASVSTGTKQHKFARPAWRGPYGKEGVAEAVAHGASRALRRNF